MCVWRAREQTGPGRFGPRAWQRQGDRPSLGPRRQADDRLRDRLRMPTAEDPPGIFRPWQDGGAPDAGCIGRSTDAPGADKTRGADPSGVLKRSLSHGSLQGPNPQTLLLKGRRRRRQTSSSARWQSRSSAHTPGTMQLLHCPGDPISAALAIHFAKYFGGRAQAFRRARASGVNGRRHREVAVSACRTDRHCLPALRINQSKIHISRFASTSLDLRYSGGAATPDP